MTTGCILFFFLLVNTQEEIARNYASLEQKLSKNKTQDHQLLTGQNKTQKDL